MPATRINLDALRAARAAMHHPAIETEIEHMRYEARCGKCGAHYQRQWLKLQERAKEAMRSGRTELVFGTDL